MRTPHLWYTAILSLAILGSTGCVERALVDVTGPGDIRIVAILAEPTVVSVSGQSRLTAQVDNPSGSPVSYYWNAYRGLVQGTGPEVTYFGSYCCAGTDWVILTVENEAGEKHTNTLVLTVIPE